MKFFILILFSISSFVYAEVYLKTCTDSQQEAMQVKQKLNFIFHPNDKLKISENCLELFTNKKRFVLYQNYLKSEYPSLSLQIISNESNQYCNIKIFVEDTLKQDLYTTNLKKINAKDVNKNIRQTIALKNLEKKEASFVIDNQKIFYTCELKTDGAIINIRSNEFQTSQKVLINQKSYLFSLIKYHQENKYQFTLPGDLKIQNKQGRKNKKVSILYLGY